MEYTPEQFERLPKWAQRKIEGQEREIQNLKAKVASLSSDHPDSNVKISDFVHGDHGLPANSEIDFYLSEGRQKWQDMITIRARPGVLHVSTSDRLVIRCAGGVNGIELSIER